MKIKVTDDKELEKEVMDIALVNLLVYQRINVYVRNLDKAD